MIKLVFFARLREQLGLSEHRVTLSDNLTVQTLVEHLIASDDDSNAGSGNSKWQLLLADEVVVNGAELKDGMLIVDLEKIVPEEKKPRSIKIS